VRTEAKKRYQGTVKNPQRLGDESAGIEILSPVYHASATGDNRGTWTSGPNRW
jgi:hypothetical protein